MRFVALACAAFGLAACGTPNGFSSSPPNADNQSALQGCLNKAWAYPKPESDAVYIDCMVGLGYVPEPQMAARREELRQQGY